MRAEALVLLGILLLSAACNFAAAQDVELEGLDGPDLVASEAGDIGAKALAGELQDPGQCLDGQCYHKEPDRPQAKPQSVAGVTSRRRATAPVPPPPRPKNYYLEAAAVVVLVCYVLVAIWGTNVNSKIADGFARTHCMGESAIFPRQFALCGAGEATAAGARKPLLKEGSSTFKFYASGRRHCQGCLATLQLRSRPDLMSWPLSLFRPSEDLLEIEVYMNEANMPLTVLAVGTPRQTRTLSDRKDVHALAKALKVHATAGPSDPLHHWPASKLSVLAEHSSVFYDIFSDPRVASVFTSPAHADKLRLFRSLLVTSENSGGSHKRLLRFVFALPAADDMAALGPLLSLVPLIIDLVGIVKLSPEVKKKASDARARLEAATNDAEETRKKRIEAMQRRKIEKALEEKERLSRLNPEARRKAEEKLAKQAAKKSMKVKMVRM